MKLTCRILNVFTDGDNPFSGNPLCVFEDASGLSDKSMQNLARQLNLSETTFITSRDADVTANVRIFTPNYEMPFAGHPTLGTAYVVRELLGTGDAVVLRMPAGDIPVQVAGDVWTLEANAPTYSQVEVPRPDLARMIGLTADRIAAEPLWVDAGTVQLILPLRSAEDVTAAAADPRLLAEFATRPEGEALVYVWAPTGPDTIEARFFFTQNNAAVEDPATGSACANLGGWFLAHGERGIRRRIHQGSAIQRPSVLDLTLDEQGTILVSGTVREVGRGTFTI
ncbi:MAG TPA: PhzF family phenazine biosynthesis protein [Dermatophilaceae bacterium]|nr:PhzF family phenazine biosynthesis protein [Dermatophilaceae bacterium]